MEVYGYYDLLLITKDGMVVYSFKRESDLGQNILTGSLKNSHLNKCFQESLKGLAIQDFESYSPSNNQQIAFIMTPFYGKDRLSAGSKDGQDPEAQEPLGVVVLKLNKRPTNTIVQRREGMGKTGESYLVGQKDGKIVFRSDSVLRGDQGEEGDNIIKIGKEAALPFLEKAFSGQAGSEIYAHDGRSQMVSYSPLNIEGLNWVLVSKIDETEAFEAVNKLKWMMTPIALICIGVIVMVGLFFTRSIIKPIKRVINKIKDIAEGEGDLTSRLEIKSKDEMGELAQWFNTFIDKLQLMIKNIAGNAETLNRSSSQLSNLSGQMSEGASQMASKANSVAAAGEEMSSNMNSVASAMEEASTNVGMVATSAEEMTATINEIAQNSEKARSITNEAVSRAQDASVKVDELGNAAQEIGKVTEAITEISEQTNLLALNATIEAARAGEAGKGFAVVANEIKELARQTAEATREIKERIDGIQNSTSGTVSEIEQILKVINDVNEIVSTIATAVEEQSLTTKEIATNVAQASQGIQEVNENVSQSSSVSSEIAKDITDVNQAVGEMSNSSSQINLNSAELSKLAEELSEMVRRFKI
jgi:methyl-accepting chemotaxis protein